MDNKGNIKGNDCFAGCSPTVNFIFYIVAVLYGMFFSHPVFLICSLCFSAAYYITLKGVKAFKLIGGLAPAVMAVALINPLVGTYGRTVLFYYANGRPYTLEAFMYGAALGIMFASVILWFASYNVVMTSDKFLYIFGRCAPALSLVMTLIMRLVPGYRHRIKQISTARQCIGLGGAGGSLRQKAENSMAVLSSLTSWSLEGGVTAADSMRCRGYGSGRRSSFSIYSFDTRDRILLAVMMILAAAAGLCGICGGAAVVYTPEFHMTGIDEAYCLVGAVSYSMLLAIPTALDATEALIWHILKSKI